MILEAKKYKVSLFDETYSFVSDEPEERVRKGFILVESLVSEISDKAGPSVSQRHVAILALIKTAIQLQSVEEELGKYKQQEEELLKVFELSNQLVQI